MDKRRFKFDLPTEWEDQTVYSFSGPKIDETNHLLTMMLDRHLQYDNISDFAAEKTAPLTENLSGLEILKDEEVSQEGCNPVYEFVCRWMPDDTVQIIRKDIFVICGGYGFTFHCDFSKKSYKMLGGQMKKIVESILPGTYEPPEED